MTEFRCPSCGSNGVITLRQTIVMANTGEIFGHYSEDAPNAKARCVGCDWKGTREQFDVKVLSKEQKDLRHEQRQLTKTNRRPIPLRK